MRKILFNKKGISLAELVVCVVVMGLLIALFGQVMHETNNGFNMVEKQWKLQEEIKYIMDSLLRDSASGSLSTANYVDLLYEDMEAAKTSHKFASCDELGSFTQNGDVLTFAHANTECIYIFNYNSKFYILNRGQTVAEPFKLNAQVDVDVEFSVATNVLPLTDNKETEGVHYEDEHGMNVVDRRYVPDGLSVVVKSAEKYLPAKYSMQSSYSLKNMSQGQKINITDGHFSSTYVSGWNAEIADSAELYYNNPALRVEANYPNINRAANIIKYTSSSAYFGQADAGGGEFSSQAQCATRWLMMNQQFAEPVVDSLHDFRDNVLKGNALGEFVIDKYYDWSPAVIKFASEHEFAEKALRKFVVRFAMIVD